LELVIFLRLEGEEDFLSPELWAIDFFGEGSTGTLGVERTTAQLKLQETIFEE
jgi:hypothetical protein